MLAVRPQRSIVLAAGLRTPFVRAGNAYASENAGHLGARVAREVITRAGIDPGDISEVITGCVGEPHDQANVSRVIALRAGVPRHVPARTVARNCASGMEAVTSAATALEAGHGDLYLCVGVEVMSAYPLVFGKKMTRLFAGLAKAKSLPARLATLASFRPSFLKPRVALMEGLTDPTCGLIMGKTAEILARDFDISREDADQFALESHRRAGAARDAGRFAGELLPHLPLDPGRKPASIESDDGIRDSQTIEALGKLRPYFEKPDGIVTVGNSCGITDGAAAMFVATEERARELGLDVLARLRGYAWAGLDPARMGLGPVFASAGALAAAGCELSDMETIEINEAFAAQVLACAKAFASDAFAREHQDRLAGRGRALGELDPARTNPNGGAIALGHPVGATGTRLLLTTAQQLRTKDQSLGLATLCIGGGQGGAVILERAA